ncbi:MAG: ABC transporter permease [Gammaproteobacteria bacterium]|nr:ABC transporter permease [Gammaproteobacteria bacterium]
MIRLFTKEVRQLLPITFLWVSILILNLGYLLYTKRFDEESFYSWCEDYCGFTVSAELVLPFVVLIFIFAYSLFPREHDEATIDLLYAMPISRIGVFLAKVFAALSIMFVLIAVDHLLNPTLLGLNRSSMDGQFYPDVLIPMLIRDLIFAYVVLCYGILLSWFRTIGLILFIVYVIGISIAESVFSNVGAFNLFTFHNNDYFGKGLVLNWSTIVPHVIAATTALVAGGLLWINTDSKKQQKTKLNSKWISIPLSIIAFITLFGVITADLKLGDSADTTQLVARETDHYRFVYNDHESAIAVPLIEQADADYQAIANYLGVTSDPYIQTDLTDKLSHAAGLATWKTIKMDLKIPDDGFNQHVLAHESVHVFQGVESERAMMEARGHTKFFSEGMADYVAQRIAPYDAVKEINETVGAASWKIQKIRFDDIVNFASFETRFNPELVYTMGSLWSEALVNTCGESVLGDVLRSMGRDDAPRGLSGKVFWQDTLQHINCELESVNASWRALMQQQLDNHDTRWATEFSEITFTPSDDGQRFVVQLIAKPHPDFPQAVSDYTAGAFDLRIASQSQFSKSGDYYIRGNIVDDSNPNALVVEFTVYTARIPNNLYRYQIGVSTHPESFGYFGQWQKGRTP